MPRHKTSGSFKKDHIPYMKGKHHSEETKRKMSLAKKELVKNGWKPWDTGKSRKNEDPKKFINKIVRCGKDNGFYGKKHSIETKQIISENMTKKWTESDFRNDLMSRWQISKKSESFINHCKLHRSKMTFPLKDSKPEKMVQLALSLEGIHYKKHKLIKVHHFYHQVDLFIEPNICIEVDGDYWHSLPYMVIRDVEVNEKLNSLGYVVIRIAEKRIKEDAKLAFINILNMIKQNMVSLKI